MFVFRHIAILGFAALLTGCSDYQCPGPGYPSFKNCPTNFLLKVVAVDVNSGQVEGLVSDRVPGVKARREKDREFAKRIEKPYKIYVRDLKTLVEAGRLVKGKEYVFHNGNGSPFLEAFPEGHELPLEKY